MTMVLKCISYDDDIEQFTVSTAFDVSTATYLRNNNALDIYSQESSPTSLAINNDGTKMFVLDSSGDDINEYDLASAIPGIATVTYLRCW